MSYETKLINFSITITTFNDSLHFNPDNKLDDRTTSTAHSQCVLPQGNIRHNSM
jgi:hypothetical protein